MRAIHTAPGSEAWIGGIRHGAVVRCSVLFGGNAGFGLKPYQGQIFVCSSQFVRRQEVEMRISSDQKIAGYPALQVRELMRRAAGGPIRFWDVCQILQCSDTAAARVIKHLERDGLIVSVEGSMEPSTKGND